MFCYVSDEWMMIFFISKIFLMQICIKSYMDGIWYFYLEKSVMVLSTWLSKTALRVLDKSISFLI